MENELLYLVLALGLGLFMAWGIGANDVANAMATSIGSRALSIRQALVIAAVFEFAGAVLAGGEVTSTIRKGMVDSSAFADDPDALVIGMLAALGAAGTWLLAASRLGWPVSTTHSIVGAIVGFTLVGVGTDAVQWPRVGTIAASWVVSPLFSALVSYLVYRSIAVLILESDEPLARARRYSPVYVFVTIFLIALITLFKGLKHVDIGIRLTPAECYVFAATFGLAVAMLSAWRTSHLEVDEYDNREFAFYTVERVFGTLMVITACSMAFAHGSNDVANAIGPVAAIVSVTSTGSVTGESLVPLWTLMLGGLGIVLGLATYGRHVIETVGARITPLTPSRGFSAGIAASFTIVFASGTGMPVSTTHALVGAVLGVGIARGRESLDFRVVGRIVLSWVITIPAGALLAAVYFVLMRATIG